MVQPLARRRVRRSGEEMGRHLSDKDRRGLSYVEVSRQTGIPVSTLQWWRARLRKGQELRDPPRRRKRRSKEQVPFVEALLAAVPESPLTRSAYEIVLRNGRTLRLEGRVEPDSLRVLLGVLEDAC